MRKLLCTALCSYFLFCAFSTFAQIETGLQLMPQIWQSNRTNPALLPDDKFIIGLPSIAGVFYSNQPTWNDFLNEDNSQITLDRALEVMEDQNILNTNLNVETFSLGIWKGDWHWSLHHTLKAETFLDYPKTLPQLIWEGNEPFIGQTVDISHDFQVVSYQEFGLGLGKKINRYLNLGMKLKWLNGLNEASTEQNQLEVYTDPEIYDVSLRANYKVNSSSLLEYNGLQDWSNVVDVGELLRETLFTPNQGIAVDLGAQLNWHPFTLAASILDLGYINWKEDVNNYLVEGVFDYRGLDIARDYFDNTLDFSAALDSLREVLVVQTSAAEYRTNLTPKFYISAWYQLPKWQFGASFFGAYQRAQFFPALTIQAQTQLGKILWLGANYTTYQNTYNHVGLNVLCRLGVWEVFATTHDFVALLAARNQNWVNFRAGVNLCFGNPAIAKAKQ